MEEEATCKEFLQVQKEGIRQIKRNKKHYNFRMILAVGYRVRSNLGVHFRNWASNIPEEYSRKGFAMNDWRLKNSKQFGERGIRITGILQEWDVYIRWSVQNNAY